MSKVTEELRASIEDEITRDFVGRVQSKLANPKDVAKILDEYYIERLKNESSKLPLRGFVVITIPVGSIPVKDVPDYLAKASYNMFKDNLDARIKAVGYAIFFMPSRPGYPTSASGPTIEVLKLDEGETTTLMDLLKDLPEEMKAKLA